MHAMHEGIFGLSQPDELLNKLEHDFQRLQASEGQQTMLYTAFDVFVTADSLVDWVQNSGVHTEAEVKALRGLMITKICADLANGSKHFRLDRASKTETLSTHRASPAFGTSFSPGQFQTQWSTWVRLSPSEAAAANVPAICPVIPLAEKVLAHWRRYLACERRCNRKPPPMTATG
jgi:hypothetical protein